LSFSESTRAESGFSVRGDEEARNMLSVCGANRLGSFFLVNGSIGIRQFLLLYESFDVSSSLSVCAHTRLGSSVLTSSHSPLSGDASVLEIVCANCRETRNCSQSFPFDVFHFAKIRLEWRPVSIVWSFLGRLLGLLFRFSLFCSRTLCGVLSIASALNCTSVGILLSTVRIWVTSSASES
jgi:hypothetical protein